MANFMDMLKNSLNSQRELSEVERVRQNMVQIETEIQQKFMQLGAIFFKDHLEDDQLEESYKEIVDQVKKLDQNRKGFHSHMLRLEGNMMCVNCGEIIPYGSVYCSKCGKRADGTEE